MRRSSRLDSCCHPWPNVSWTPDATTPAVRVLPTSCSSHLLFFHFIFFSLFFLFFSFLWLTNKNLKVRFCCSITAAEQHDQIVYVLYSNSIWSLCFHTLKNKIAAEILYLRSSLFSASLCRHLSWK